MVSLVEVVFVGKVAVPVIVAPIQVHPRTSHTKLPRSPVKVEIPLRSDSSSESAVASEAGRSVIVTVLWLSVGAVLRMTVGAVDVLISIGAGLAEGMEDVSIGATMGAVDDLTSAEAGLAEGVDDIRIGAAAVELGCGTGVVL